MHTGHGLVSAPHKGMPLPLRPGAARTGSVAICHAVKAIQHQHDAVAHEHKLQALVEGGTCVHQHHRVSGHTMRDHHHPHDVRI